MAIAHLSPEEMRQFADADKRYPRAVKLDELVRAYAEQQGGLTLSYWKLALGRLWGEPIMMSTDEVAKRLHRPVSELQAIVEETDRAVRPEWEASAEYHMPFKY
jgi:hypothetical protein